MLTLRQCACVRAKVMACASLPQVRWKASTRKSRKDNPLEKYIKAQEKKKATKVYKVHEGMTVRDLAKTLDMPKENVFELLTLSQATVKDHITPIRNRALLSTLASRLKCKFQFVSEKPKEDNEEENLDVVHEKPRLEDIVSRPPVVTIVGHIDHGKTTLLDYLRNSAVVDSEFGGITQHIGAFSVELNRDVKVTILDTPGHAAFKTMRVRGANMTDIIVLVVDAVEGPLEQTLESVSAANAARVPMVVAINKIDKPGANVEDTKRALYEEAGVHLEDYGGDVQSVAISALKGTGVSELVEAILAQAEIMQLSADPKGPVEAAVVESYQEKGLGNTATVLVRRGTLEKGHFLVAGETYARVKMLLDTRPPIADSGERTEVTSALPSEAVRVIGWKEVPRAGTEVLQVEDEKRALQVIRWRKNNRCQLELKKVADEIEQKRRADRKVYEEYRLKKLKAGTLRPRYGRHDFYVREKEYDCSEDNENRLLLLIKADVDGSLEAIMNCLRTYESDEVPMEIIKTGVGEVTDGDLNLASELGAVVYAFNVPLVDDKRKKAGFMGVPLKEFNVIYGLVDDLKVELGRRLPLQDVDYQVGKGVVLQQFLVSEGRAKLPVAGCRVSSGQFDIKKSFRVLRGKQVVWEGSAASLKHLKDEVSTIPQGQECGLRLDNTNIVYESGDVIVCYEVKQESRETDWRPF